MAMLTAHTFVTRPFPFLRVACLLLALPLISAWSIWRDDSSPAESDQESLMPGSSLYQKCVKLTVKADEEAGEAAAERWSVAMRRDKVEYRTVKSYFRYLYGDPVEGTDDTWFVKPWYYLKMLTKNYVFLADPGIDTGVWATYMRDASAVAIYVNMNGLAQIYTELHKEMEKRLELQEAR